MGHPWDDFLDARLRCIPWMLENGHDIETMSLSLSCDPEHVVRLMRTIERRLELFATEKKRRESARRTEELFKKAFGERGVRLRIDTGAD